MIFYGGKVTYDKLPFTRWLDKSGQPIPGQPELPAEKAAEIKNVGKRYWYKKNLIYQAGLKTHSAAEQNSERGTERHAEALQSV